ncbi:hypothetical protein HELRODRAFT_185812 [Helobdella robusta]|uniref:Uncharacterized protein n=1 Tax=Helobdella robusta TaxID=6412 RepID=T1FNB8_HELRO|nr:hypothetical protein HELRODRAFT_185812 [Helobdella robusta]ESN99526.1 hypothetical protein HELRODRAFT_185812 [Helobdella robusta]
MAAAVPDLETDESESNLLFFNFNQNYSAISVGTKTGYRLLSLASIDKFDVVHEDDTPEVNAIDRFFSSSLLALVSLTAPRKLRVCHFKKTQEICNFSYSSAILGVKLNRTSHAILQRLVVCLEDSIHIHGLKDMRTLHSINNIPYNPKGLFALASGNENCFLAWPSSNIIGEVHVFDCISQRDITTIHAHDNPLAAIAFSTSSSMIATASEKGTIIRVFSLPDGQKIFEFRRGVKRCATIHSLSFSQDSRFLCCSSNTETIHIFNLESTKDEKPVEESQGGWMDYLSGALRTSASYLPTQVTEILNQGRDFAVARLHKAGLKNVSAIACIQRATYVLVACEDGFLYVFNFNTSIGGECPYVKRLRFDVMGESGNAEVADSMLINGAAASWPFTKDEPSEDRVKEPADDLKLDDENEFPPVVHGN